MELSSLLLSPFLYLFLCFFLLRRFRAETDFGNLDPRQLPPMADGAVITFPAAIFERDDLLIFALLDHFAGDGGPFDERAAVSEFVAVAIKKHVGEYAFFSRLLVEKVNVDDVALGHAMLPAASFDNSVSHRKGNALGEEPRKITRMHRFDKGKYGGTR